MTTATETKPPLVLPTIKLTSNRILVLVHAAKQKTEGGILLPDGAELANECKNKGYVVAVGPGQLTGEGDVRLPMSCEVYDEIYFNRYNAGEFYKENGVTYAQMKDSDVVGVTGLY